MTGPVSDPRAVTEFRVPAAALKQGDLVNLSPGEDDWQQVLAVYSGAKSDTGGDGDMRALVNSLDGRYVVVVLTDLAPVDNNVYFADGHAVIVSPEESGDDVPVADVASVEYGERTYLYTKFELVSVRSA